MCTTLSFDEELIKELMRVTGAKTKVEAIHLAISEFVRRKKLESLLTPEGMLPLDVDWRELKERELKAQDKRESRWLGHR